MKGSKNSLRRSGGSVGPVELEAILDSIADGVFTVDKDFVITSFNRAAERITGFSSREAIGRKCYNVFRTSVCQGECLLRESMQTGREITNRALTILDRNNKEVPISVSTAVLRDARGGMIGGVETFRDLSAVEELRREIRGRWTLRELISKNHRMLEIFSLVPDVAASSASVLIQGETGTGKELLARAIHFESPRADKPFVTVNCGALPDSLLESELFGHVAGAFTDARQPRIGRFEAAHGGTIFLDEIGDMSPAMQVKILRVLQEGRFEPVGSSEPRSVSVRVIAATHRDLQQLVAEGRFRHDLYYRINTVLLTIPPLRERREDIPLLVEHFMERQRRLTGKPVRTLSAEALHALMTYDWPGNVRQLEHAIEHAFVVAKGDIIHLKHLPKDVVATSQTGLHRTARRTADPLAESQRRAIQAALDRHDWNRIRAARELRISRSTLWRKMRRLGISRATDRRIYET